VAAVLTVLHLQKAHAELNADTLPAGHSALKIAILPGFFMSKRVQTWQSVFYDSIGFENSLWWIGKTL
jgi:hypothetical protein